MAGKCSAEEPAKQRGMVFSMLPRFHKTYKSSRCSSSPVRACCCHRLCAMACLFAVHMMYLTVPAAPCCVPSTPPPPLPTHTHRHAHPPPPLQMIGSMLGIALAGCI
jgi:hypothetical protein